MLEGWLGMFIISYIVGVICCIIIGKILNDGGIIQVGLLPILNITYLVLFTAVITAKVLNIVLDIKPD